jgi:uridine kinase
MKGDVVLVEEHHRRAAIMLVQVLAERIREVARGARRYTITVAGESGSGKSETAAAIAAELRERGIGAVVLAQDDYFVLPPRSNDARRREDPDWLGPHVEVRLDLLDRHLREARAGAETIVKPLVDYQANAVEEETVDLRGVKALIAEGTYTSLLRHVDTRVFIARSRLDTLEHRKKRGRGAEIDDPFVEQVLAAEHRIITGHRQLADFLISKDYDVRPAD